MARAYLDVTPDMLPLIPALLPRGANVFGSVDMGGAVRLILEGNDLPDQAMLEAIITDEPLKRTIEYRIVDA